MSAALCGVFLLLCGLQFQFEAAEPRVAASYAEVYQRATAEFLKASFYKPLESGTNELAFTLAPLIIQEVKSPESQVQARDQFGTVCWSNGFATLDRSRPAVYFSADSVQFNGRAHARFTYVWFYSVEPQAEDTALGVQGIRLTLTKSGEPALWEMLADVSGKELFFVSQSLEAAARAEFGKPLPGRRYAVEPSLKEGSNKVVARVIDDGPLPMGPIVYLNAETKCIGTIICRCMPAQAKELLATRTYELLPLSAFDARLIRAQTRSQVRPAFWPGNELNNGKLTSHLRLPSPF